MNLPEWWRLRTGTGLAISPNEFGATRMSLAPKFIRGYVQSPTFRLSADSAGGLSSFSVVKWRRWDEAGSTTQPNNGIMLA